MDAEGAAEPLPKFWARAGEAWEAAAAAAHAPGGRTVAVVAHSAIISAMLCRCLGLGAERLSLFRSAPGRRAAPSFQGFRVCSVIDPYLCPAVPLPGPGRGAPVAVPLGSGEARCPIFPGF